MQCALGALSPRHALATRCLAPPTHKFSTAASKHYHTLLAGGLWPALTHPYKHGSRRDLWISCPWGIDLLFVRGSSCKLLAREGQAARLDFTCTRLLYKEVQNAEHVTVCHEACLHFCHAVGVVPSHVLLGVRNCGRDHVACPNVTAVGVEGNVAIELIQPR